MDKMKLRAVKRTGVKVHCETNPGQLFPGLASSLLRRKIPVRIYQRNFD